MSRPCIMTDAEIEKRLADIESNLRPLQHEFTMLTRRLYWRRRKRAEAKTFVALYHGRTYDDDKAALPI